MASRKKPASKPPKRTPAYIIYARVRPDLGALFDAFLASTKPKATAKAALEMILEEFFAGRGQYAPSDAPVDAE